MFETDLLPVTFIIIIFQSYVLFFLLVEMFFKKKKHYLSFLLLTVSFMLYNLLSGLFPDKRLPINFDFQIYAVWFIGILPAIAMANHVFKEYLIEQIKILNPKILFITVSIVFLIGFCVPYFLTASMNLSIWVFMSFSIIITLIYTYCVIKSVSSHQGSATEAHFVRRVSFLNYALLFFLTMPVVVLIGDYQLIEQPLVNMSFVFFLINFHLKNVYNEKQKKELLHNFTSGGQKEKYSDNNPYIIHELIKSRLTSSEMDIAIMILSGKSYTQIAEALFINYGTVTKHASTIYKKMNFNNKKSFINSFIVSGLS